MHGFEENIYHFGAKKKSKQSFAPFIPPDRGSFPLILAEFNISAVNFGCSVVPSEQQHSGVSGLLDVNFGPFAT